MAKRTRWGILGPGNIARKFAEGLSVLPDAELLGVGSRSRSRADSFADGFGVPRRYDSYEALAADPDIEVIYVATPHPMHKDHSILCLKAGKAVLCEKPFAVNRKEAEAVLRVAVEEKRFIMEAMWTRFLPIVERVREWLRAGVIGEPRMVQADFGFRAGLNPQGRLFNPELAGGGLLDVGVYCVSLASMVFGEAPHEVKALADIGETNVDEQAAAVLGYSGGRLAVFCCGIRTSTPQDALIMGTNGMIRLHPPFWRGTSATLSVAGKEPETVELPYSGTGYNCEAAAVGECLRAGRFECDIMPHKETLQVMETMDRIRAEWGLVYPMERG